MRHNLILRQSFISDSQNCAAEVWVHIGMSSPISQTAVFSDCYFYKTEVANCDVTLLLQHNSYLDRTQRESQSCRYGIALLDTAS